MTDATIDANVFVSAFITPGGTPHQIWQAWRRDRFELASSEHIIGVTLAKLRSPRLAERYYVASAELALFEALVRIRAKMVAISPNDIIPVTGDPKDDAVLATARLGRSAYLITGDAGLLKLGVYAAATITPKQFLDLIEADRL